MRAAPGRRTRRSPGFYAEAGSGKISAMERTAAAKAGVAVCMDLRKDSTETHAPAVRRTLPGHRMEEPSRRSHPSRKMGAFDTVRPYDVGGSAGYTRHVVLGLRAQAAFDDTARRNRRADRDTIVLMNASHVPNIDHSISLYERVRDACNGAIHPGVQVAEIVCPSHHVFRVQKRHDSSRPVLGLFASQRIPPGEILGQYVGEVRMQHEESSDAGGDSEACSPRYAIMRKRSAFGPPGPGPGYGIMDRTTRGNGIDTVLYDVNLPGCQGDIAGCPRMYLSGATAKNELSAYCLRLSLSLSSLLSLSPLSHPPPLSPPPSPCPPSPSPPPPLSLSPLALRGSEREGEAASAS